ncbi:MAG: hypothetical protein NC321_02540 [Clostridium sp.]|nr:hypothetical protein [Clostridium sp.]
MDYYSFFEKLQRMDSRVKFVKVNKRLLCDKINIPEFYQILNPVNVEFEFHDGIVKLEPFEKLSALNEEYQYVKADCVFAICNGDPIYTRDGKIYTCVHGSKCVVEEKIAESVGELFEQVYHTL